MRGDVEKAKRKLEIELQVHCPPTVVHLGMYSFEQKHVTFSCIPLSLVTSC